MPKREIIEKDNLLLILENAQKAIEENDIISLKELSNRTVHSASIYQDTDSITVAVVIYALYKIFARPDYDKYKDWPFFLETVKSNLAKAANDLRKDRIDDFQKDISAIREIEEKLSGNFKRYVEDVFRTALISKASRIYEHGVSMEQTASLLGITLFDLAEYTGKTGISDVDFGSTLTIEKRLKKAMEFFK
jgi:hypothetical protein